MKNMKRAGVDEVKGGHNTSQGPGQNRPARAGMDTYRIEVGKVHDVQPGNIVGAIANEAGLDSKLIGRIEIQDNYSLVDLPEGMPKEIYKDLKNTWVAGRKLNITRVNEGGKDQITERTASQVKSRNATPEKNKCQGETQTER